MVEKDEKSFFEIEKFRNSEQKITKTPIEIVEPINKEVRNVEKEIEENFSDNANDLGELSLEKEAVGFSKKSHSGLENLQVNEKLIRKKEYWEKLINSIRAEKLSENESENKELQNKKILEEILDILVEKEKELIQEGEAIQVVKLFKGIVLPTIKKEDPEINEAYYWDKFHAKIVTVEGIKDLS